MHWLWLSALVVILDQFSKFFAERLLVLYAPVPVLPFFKFTLAYNPGASFGFLSQAGGWQRWFFIVLALIISTILIVWLRRLEGERLTALSLSLILGGAIGNVIDRLWHGHVIDFIDLHYAGYHWPVFNLADSAITVGALLLILAHLLPGQGKHRNS